MENEWLCVQLMREFGLPIADADILTYGKQTVLSVKRFDRRWIGATPTDALRPQFHLAAGFGAVIQVAHVRQARFKVASPRGFEPRSHP